MRPLRPALMALLATAAMVAPLTATPAFAQDPTGEAQAQVRSFDIPPQPLASALTVFGDQADMQVTVDTALVTGIQSPGVSGSFAPHEALSRLLTGSGLTWRMLGASTVRLDRAPQAAGGAIQLGPVRVEGEGAAQAGTYVPPQAEIGTLPPSYAGGQVARGGRVGTFGNRDIMDTPFSQTNLTSQLIEDQQALSLGDVLRNDPAVQAAFNAAAGDGGFSIRGFEGDNASYLFNGLIGIAPAGGDAMMTEGIERVEIIRGPSALLNGAAGNIGGIVNIVPKRAGDDRVTRLTGTYISDSQFGGHVDIGRRFGADQRFGIRLNAAYRDGDSAIDHNGRESVLATLGLDYRGTAVRLSADLGYQDQKTRGPREHINVADGFDVPKPRDTRTNVNAPWEIYNNRVPFGTIRGEWDIAPNVTAFAGAGYNNRRNQAILTIRAIGDPQGALVADSGFLYESSQRNIAADAGIRGDLEFGGMRHQLVAAYTLAENRLRLSSFETYDVPQSNLYRPIFASPPPASLFPSVDGAPKLLEGGFHSFMLGDTVSVFDEKLQLTVGIRWQQVEQTFFNPTGDVSSSYNERAVTPAVGLLVKPWSNVSLYANYIEGLEQGPRAPDTAANAFEVFAPYVTKGYEAGVKVDLGRLATTVAVYQMAQPSGLIDPVTNIFGIDGERRHRGVEVSVFGEVSDGIRILASASYINARLVKTEDGLNEGNEATLPPFQFVLNGEWDLPFAPGLTLSSRLAHASSQFQDPANTRKIAQWTQWDMGARYRLVRGDGRAITFRATINNILDTTAWSSTTRGSVLPRDPRTFLLSATIDF